MLSAMRMVDTVGAVSTLLPFPFLPRKLMLFCFFFVQWIGGMEPIRWRKRATHTVPRAFKADEIVYQGRYGEWKVEAKDIAEVGLKDLFNSFFAKIKRVSFFCRVLHAIHSRFWCFRPAEKRLNGCRSMCTVRAQLGPQIVCVPSFAGHSLQIFSDTCSLCVRHWNGASDCTRWLLSRDHRNGCGRDWRLSVGRRARADSHLRDAFEEVHTSALDLGYAGRDVDSLVTVTSRR